MEHTSERNVTIENEQFRLIVGADCIVRSLVLKATGEELAAADEEIALFSVTQERPFNNEIKLAHPNKRTTYQGNRLERDGDLLTVGFECAPYTATISIKELPGYVDFHLVGFTVLPNGYGHRAMDLPPVAVLRLIQLPIRHRERFGEWLNVVWDDTALVNVLGATPYAIVDSEKRRHCRILYSEASREVKLYGADAALIVCNPRDFLDIMDTFEKAHGLPLGVESRRGPWINRSAYWTDEINPANVDQHIEYAKLGGFTMMLIYYQAIFKLYHSYDTIGDYDFNDRYPGGFDDLKKMLKKIKDAGITPGIHFLHTHIGVRSRYVTPVLDPRLNKTRRFTLARPLGTDDTEIYVEENPEGAMQYPDCRVLGFGGEAIYYEGYVTEPPYRFIGCKRGYYDTIVTEHPAGQIGGTLDLSEFGHCSIYVDQNTSLQDEIADKLAAIYRCGFEYCYFDGSEGTNAPFGFHVSNAQYRVFKKLEPAPVYTEGAAKTHFDWHFLTGGNAFDEFAPEEFKEKIIEHPSEEAPRMRQDFTRLNFGWWGFWGPGDTVRSSTGRRPSVIGMQADMFEFGTAQGAAWDSPVTLQNHSHTCEHHPRFRDIFEVLRRWEDVRQNGFLTEERKNMLKNTKQEYTLLINEEGEYELVPCFHVTTAAGSDPLIRAFLFERRGQVYVSYWHCTGSADLSLDADARDLEVTDVLGGEPLPLKTADGRVLVPVENKRYMRSRLSREAMIRILENGRLV